MLIGVPKETKNQEYRTGLTPSSVKELVNKGHKVIVEKNLGTEIGFSDEIYKSCGAEIVQSAKEVFDRAQMIVKVKEPSLSECKMLKEDQILFTYLHLAALPDTTKALIESKCTAIAYETITKNGRLPLLAPMSEVAGKMSVHVGNYFLHKAKGGSGVLLSGIAGVAPGNIVILGAGVVGTAALLMAMGLGANIIIIDKSIERLRSLEALYHGKINTVYSTEDSIANAIKDADLVIGAVLIPGAEAVKLITKPMLKTMKAGSVIVDVAVDQGGCCETTKATTHDNPTYIVDKVIHYCVANMPGAMAKTASIGLNNATLPYVISLANNGLKALIEDKEFAEGLNVYKGNVTYKAVAEALNLTYINYNTLALV